MIYGIIGLIVELLLPIYIATKMLKKIIKNIKIFLDDEIIILGTVLVLLLLVSYMAGHSLMHPAVAFYIAYVINDLFKRIRVL